MKNIYKVSLLSSLVFLQGCVSFFAAVDGATRSRYDDSKIVGEKANLRTIYDYAGTVYIDEDFKCKGLFPLSNGKPLKTKPVPKTTKLFESKFTITFQRKSIGMPFPPFEWDRKSDLVYSEFHIPANKKLLVKMRYSEGKASCDSAFYWLRARQNANYEAEVSVVDESYCRYIMKEILEDGSRVNLKPNEWEKADVEKMCKK